MEIRELRAFVAVVDAGGVSAAARGLHLSQSALSQTIRSLERQLGTQLLVRDRQGSQPTEAGRRLARQARDLLAQHDRIVADVTGALAPAGGPVRIGVPLELPPQLLPRVLTRLALERPDARVELVHASTAAQLLALHAGELDLALVRERPADAGLDSVLASAEPLGVLVATGLAESVADAAGVALPSLSGQQWLAFPRSDSPNWYDQVAATLRSHGVHGERHAHTDTGPLTAEVKFAAIATGTSFALAPPGWTVPPGISWQPLAGSPLVRQTWAVWRAASTDPVLAALVAALEEPAASA